MAQGAGSLPWVWVGFFLPQANAISSLECEAVAGCANMIVGRLSPVLHEARIGGLEMLLIGDEVGMEALTGWEYEANYQSVLFPQVKR
jgi:hypothetical protein